MEHQLPKLKLIYFDIPGKGEPIRKALRYAGLEFEDYRFKSKEEFQQMKQSGKLMFGQVPALEVNGTIINQTPAILRFVAKLGRKYGKAVELYPQDELQAALVDAIMDDEADAFMGLRVFKYKERFGFDPSFFTEEVSNNISKSQNEAVIPKHLKSLESILEKSTTKWLVGPKEPTIADFLWAPVLKSLTEGWSGDKTVLSKFPKLVELVDAFYSLPGIQA